MQNSSVKADTSRRNVKPVALIAGKGNCVNLLRGPACNSVQGATATPAFVAMPGL